MLKRFCHFQNACAVLEMFKYLASVFIYVDFFSNRLCFALDAQITCQTFSQLGCGEKAPAVSVATLIVISTVFVVDSYSFFVDRLLGDDAVIKFRVVCCAWGFYYFF